ncbi:alpha/beta hydrolase [Brevundimonas naejangsanensis]|uniref:Alpha/beta hydrolase n=1 Tax=Brevundimonas naejangsanensis TaxID=588932 RepID=A0A494RKL0_9CAUL|nr:alpha/beta hydrolase [Brevundimonas naejangsanensis]AYG94492.1 alpha/beta hydrolase [Brevundimonas naejangsanensis]
MPSSSRLAALPVVFAVVAAGVLAGVLVGVLAGGTEALAAGQAPAAAAYAPAPFQSSRILVEARGRARGEGPDVVLIPGLASTSAVWARAAAGLEDRYRVHLVTVRGFGDTAAGANAEGLVGAPTAAEIRRYIEEQGLQRPALIGHSMGGQVALRVAADAGDRVGRVMVVDASPFFPSLISPGSTAADVEPLARLAYQALMLLGDQALRTQATSMGLELGGAADSLFDGLGWQGGDRRVLAQGLYEVMTTDLRARLPLIAAPVTVVYGWSPDDRNPRSQVDELFRAGYRSLPRPATFERIEGAEHMVMIDQPRSFQQAVERFLR